MNDNWVHGVSSQVGLNQLHKQLLCAQLKVDYAAETSRN